MAYEYGGSLRAVVDTSYAAARLDDDLLARNPLALALRSQGASASPNLSVEAHYEPGAEAGRRCGLRVKALRAIAALEMLVIAVEAN